VIPRLLPLPALPDTDTLVDRVIQTMLEQKLVAQGDRFVIAFGSPVGQRTPTNAIGVIAV
jgi:pyruvate kinase